MLSPLMSVLLLATPPSVDLGDVDALLEADLWPEAAPGVCLRAWLPEAVRRTTVLAGQVEIYHDAPRTSRLHVKSIEVLVGERVLYRQESDLELQGDDGIYREFQHLAELVTPDQSKRHAHRRLPHDIHRAFDPEEMEGLSDEFDVIGQQIAGGGAYGSLPAFDVVPVRLDLRPILVDEVGAFVDLRIRVRGADVRGRDVTAEIAHRIARQEDFPRMPLTFGGRGDLPAMAAAGEWFTGDLHVHDCKEEVGRWRGCPSCPAEPNNLGADNDLATLKSQFVASGADWFTSTSHSYCLESAEEYAEVRDEALALSQDGDFLVLADTELSSIESGQEGCPDLGELGCILLKGSNHTGAHFISEWLPGGKDLFMGMCMRPIYPILDNITTIRGQGGLPIIMHPCGRVMVSNSNEVLTGIEDDGLHGTEIWNGPHPQNQGAQVRWWVDRLLEGHKMYGYSGSDTHDDVYDFGWNHVYIWGGLTVANLRRSIERGLVYVSNHQYLVIAARVPGKPWMPMGGEVSIPTGVGTVNTLVAVSYDLGERTGGIEVYRGRTYDQSETLIGTFDAVTGSGNLLVSDTATRDRTTYYRASSSTGDAVDDGVAYTNPVWFVPR